MAEKKLDIKTARENAGVTQEQLALATGVAQSTVACWETNRSAPVAGMLPSVAEACKCGIDDLYRS